jgi:sugar O-acyltransferase (sialic acid O-acetyltransferase NeuD family)
MNKIVLFGTGMFASVIYSYLRHDSPYEVVGFTVDGDHLEEHSLFGLPVVAFEDVASSYPPADHGMMIAVGYQRMNRLRREKYERAKQMGYQLPSYVSSQATVLPESSLGENCVIGPSTVIQPFAQVGNNIYMAGGIYIGHHSIVQDHCFIAAGTVVLSLVNVGPHCFLGANSTIKNKVTVARECLVGAGAVVLRDTAEKQVLVSRGRAAQVLPTPSDLVALD